jgi:myosin heavy subunit
VLLIDIAVKDIHHSSTMNYGTDSSATATQCDAWNREERSVREAVVKADRERAFAEQRCYSLHMGQQQLSNETRELSDALGRFHSERGFLVKENERHIQLLNADRSMMEESVHKSEEMSRYETEEKAEFCKEAEALNEELAMLHMHQEDRRLKKLLSNDTISALHRVVTGGRNGDGDSRMEQRVSQRRRIRQTIREDQASNHVVAHSGASAAQGGFLSRTKPMSLCRSCLLAVSLFKCTRTIQDLTKEGLLEMEFGWYDQSAGKTDHDGDMRDKAGTFYEQFPASQEESDA